MRRSTWIIVIIPFAACTEVAPPEVVIDDRPLTIADCAGGRGELAQVWSSTNEHGAISSQAIAPARDGVVVAGADGTLKRWNLDTQEVDWASGPGLQYGIEWGTDAVISALSYAPDGWMVSGSTAGNVTRRTDDGFAMDVLQADGSTEPVATTGVAMTAAGLIAVVDASFGGNPRLWDAITWTVTPLTTMLWGAGPVAFLSSGDLITAGHNYGTPMLELRASADLVNPASTYGDVTIEGSLRAVALSTDESTIVAAGDGVLVVLDRARLATATSQHVDAALHVAALAMLPGDRYVAAVTDDATLRFYDLDAEELLSTPLPSRPAGVSVDATGERLVVSGEDGIVRVLACQTDL